MVGRAASKKTKTVHNKQGQKQLKLSSPLILFYCMNVPVTTSSKKQKIDDDRSPLWKLVTEIPLVFAAEVLTKLNEFDLKIFYDLCRASREVVIRSKIELNNERRYVVEIESMQE